MLTLFDAIRKGDPILAANLIAKGADVNQGYPLCFAIIKNQQQIAWQLIKAGADVNKGVPLESALENRLFDLVQALIDGGADFSKIKVLGWSSITIAIYFGCLAQFRKLISNTDESLPKLLSLALNANRKNPEIIAYLLNPNPSDLASVPELVPAFDAESDCLQPCTPIYLELDLDESTSATSETTESLDVEPLVSPPLSPVPHSLSPRLR